MYKKHRHKKTLNKRRLSYKFIKKSFEDQECFLLESTYINCDTKMQYICKCGNISSISWSNFKRGKQRIILNY
jgi:hypothetical protein